MRALSEEKNAVGTIRVNQTIAPGGGDVRKVGLGGLPLWRSVAERYGVEALMPKARRRPQLSNATPAHVLVALLTLAVLRPTLGCRQLADRLGIATSRRCARASVGG